MRNILTILECSEKDLSLSAFVVWDKHLWPKTNSQFGLFIDRTTTGVPSKHMDSMQSTITNNYATQWLFFMQSNHCDHHSNTKSCYPYEIVALADLDKLVAWISKMLILFEAPIKVISWSAFIVVLPKIVTLGFDGYLGIAKTELTIVD